MGLNHTAPIGDYTAAPAISALVTTATPISSLQVNTTATTAVTAGTTATITPASMKNISAGDNLSIFGGTGTAEIVTVLSTNATTFTAAFVNAHSGTYNIVSRRPTRLGSVIINQVGTSITITLYNGNPNDTNVPNRSTIAALVPGTVTDIKYGCRAEYGLWYTVTGTTAGNYTITYIDLPL